MTAYNGTHLLGRSGYAGQP